ncbi:MAG: hypothetical protein VZR27_09015 [Acutalibacteraceae bacterium]|nr:hypothetical protein [Clostridia bacterium]MEE3450818.1 hypothetical protein [Acutalibacteraceae bacterium]
MHNKKIILFLLVLSLLALVSCSDNAGGSSKTDNTSLTDTSSKQQPVESEPNGEQRFSDLSKRFIHPAEKYSFDPETADPSNEQMYFTYDDEGRLFGCCYPIDEIQVIVSYTYKDDIVHIVTFADEYCVDDRRFRFKNDSSKGFTEFGGYYFKGVTVEKL